MAAVSLLPSSQTHDIMASRRVPLSNINNAANSPLRNVAAAAKRSRSYSSQQRDLPYGGAPPLKRQPAELEQSNPKTPTKLQSTQIPEGRVFTKKTNNAQPSAFEKKLVAARERPAQRQPQKQDRAVNENLETIRQWQRHYRKVFPHFVFYFESIPEDTRTRCSKQIQVLGAVCISQGRLACTVS
jgi:regulatory subunit for Cdc7p protein kinase